MDAATLRMTVTFNRRYFTVPCAEFINHLLQRNIQDRLGYHGVDEIKNHPFFEGIDWGMLRRGALPPPPLTPHPPLPDESRIMKSGDSAWDIKEVRFAAGNGVSLVSMQLSVGFDCLFTE